MMEYEFDQKKVDEILGEFRLDQASESQRAIIAEFVTILHEYTGIPSNNLMGFVYLSILSWENKNNTQVKMIENYSPQDRESALDAMRDNLKFMLRAVLVKPGQWQKLEKGIDISYKNYRNKWKNR